MLISISCETLLHKCGVVLKSQLYSMNSLVLQDFVLLGAVVVCPVIYTRKFPYMV